MFRFTEFKYLHSMIAHTLAGLSRVRVPPPDGNFPPPTGKEPPIRTPRYPLHQPTIAALPPWRRPALPLPDGHQGIRACTGEPAAIGTPGHIVERDRIALQDVDTLPIGHIPYS